MHRSRLDICIDILMAASAFPQTCSRLNTSNRMKSGLLNGYLSALVSGGYLTTNGVTSNPSYACTERGRKALDIYTRAAGEEAGISEIYLAVLRELGENGYKAKVTPRTRDRRKQELAARGLIENGRLTAGGKTLLEQAGNLFDLVDLALSL